MEIRNLTCIGCPMGCPLTVKLEDTEVINIEGNTCKRGAVYGKKEVTNPTRIVTTTVRVSGGAETVVSVKTKEGFDLFLLHISRYSYCYYIIICIISNCTPL